MNWIYLVSPCRAPRPLDRYYRPAEAALDKVNIRRSSPPDMLTLVSFTARETQGAGCVGEDAKQAL